MLKVLQNHPIVCNVLVIGLVFVMKKALQLFSTAEMKLQQLGLVPNQETFLRNSEENKRRRWEQQDLYIYCIYLVYLFNKSYWIFVYTFNKSSDHNKWYANFWANFNNNSNKVINFVYQLH